MRRFTSRPHIFAHVMTGDRPHGRFARSLAATLLLGTLLVVTLVSTRSSVSADYNSTKIVFEQAEFVLSDERRRPNDDAAWQPVNLPHEWRHTHPGVIGQGWYRIKFNLTTLQNRPQAIFLSNQRSVQLNFFVNGKNVGGAANPPNVSRIDQGVGTTIVRQISSGFLRIGENTIHVRMRTAAHPYNNQGLGRLTLGDAWRLSIDSSQLWEWSFYAQRSFAAMAATAGLIALFIWFARRNDHVMLWFGIAGLFWGVGNVLAFWARWSETYNLRPILSVYATYGLVVPTVILCLRTVDLRWPRFETALWAFLAVEVSFPLWLDVTNVLVLLGWDVVNTGLLLTGIAIVLRVAPRPLRRSLKTELVALLIMAVLMLYEVARFLGWVDIESTALRQYHVPVMLLAIGAAIFERHVDAIRHTEQTNVELERRVAEKTLEIEAYHAEREQALHQQTLTDERNRMVADMHDGLGASLVGLLRYVQAKPSDHDGIEQRVREALQEMRIAIDAMEPAQGDLAVVLGNLRYRLAPLMEAAGIRFAWDVPEIPKIEALDPPAVFAIQRAALEAIFNALKHAGARQIRLAAIPDDEQIAICIEDDGKGFDARSPATGLGLGTMRTRLQGLGGRLEIKSQLGGGTTVTMHIPY